MLEILCNDSAGSGDEAGADDYSAYGSKNATTSLPLETSHDNEVNPYWSAKNFASPHCIASFILVYQFIAARFVFVFATGYCGEGQ